LPLASSSPRRQSAQSRRTVRYDQIATNDLQRDEIERDARIQNARGILKPDSTRVLREDGQRAASSTGRRASGSRQGQGSSRSRGDSRAQNQRRQDSRQTSEITGQTIRKQRERQHSASPARSLKRSKALGTLIGIGVIALAAVIVYFSPVFLIKAIQVEGGWHLKDDHLTDLAQVPTDATLLSVDTNDISDRVESDPWVSSVEVSRDFPSTLTLRIVERQPVAMVVFKGADKSTGRGVWILASDGVWLGEVVNIDQEIHGLDKTKLVQVVDVEATSGPVSGEKIEDACLVNALAIVNGVSPSMKAMIEYISAPSVVQTVLYLRNNVEVAFGSAEDVEIKEMVINQLLSEYGASLQRINVRVADRPTITVSKSLSDSDE